MRKRKLVTFAMPKVRRNIFFDERDRPQPALLPLTSSARKKNNLDAQSIIQTGRVGSFLYRSENIKDTLLIVFARLNIIRQDFKSC